VLQKAPGTCRNKASCNCSTYLRAGDKGRLVGFGCMGWLVGKTGFLFRQLVTECWPGNTLRQTLTDWLAILFPYYFHTISILFPIHLCGCLRTIWITTVQTLKIVLQAKHPDGHGSSLTACCRGCSFLSRRIPWVSLPGILGVPGVRVPRGPGVPGFFLGPLRRSPWPGRSRGIHKGYA